MEEIESLNIFKSTGVIFRIPDGLTDSSSLLVNISDCFTKLLARRSLITLFFLSLKSLSRLSTTVLPAGLDVFPTLT